MMTPRTVQEQCPYWNTPCPKMPSRQAFPPPPRGLTAASQQSRFHGTHSVATGGDVDIRGASLAIGDRELLTEGRVTLRAGGRYALVGRNGAGKSLLLQVRHQRGSRYALVGRTGAGKSLLLQVLVLLEPPVVL